MIKPFTKYLKANAIDRSLNVSPCLSQWMSSKIAFQINFTNPSLILNHYLSTFLWNATSMVVKHWCSDPLYWTGQSLGKRLYWKFQRQVQRWITKWRNILYFERSENVNWKMAHGIQYVQATQFFELPSSSARGVPELRNKKCLNPNLTYGTRIWGRSI